MDGVEQVAKKICSIMTIEEVRDLIRLLREFVDAVR